MGGSSESGTSSTTKKSFQASSQNNPYFQTSTDKKGNTVSNFKDGTAGQTAYNFVNNNISGLLNDYLHPNINSPVNQAKMDIFNKQQATNLQNNILNPLTQNNMIRSSQATNMYNNLSNQAADYTKDLIANSQNDTWDMINNLVNLYTMGYNGASAEEQASINASLGGGSSTTKSSSKAG